jgi:hypothetical protein
MNLSNNTALQYKKTHEGGGPRPMCWRVPVGSRERIVSLESKSVSLPASRSGGRDMLGKLLNEDQRKLSLGFMVVLARVTNAEISVAIPESSRVCIR